MNFSDEKDYIMRIIKEMVQVLFSLMLGKEYKSVELPEGNKFDVSGKALDDFEEMVDSGFINEAENILLETIDYNKKEDILAALLFYQYVAEKDDLFLSAHNYSREEALDGIKNLAERQGYGQIASLLIDR